MFIIATQKGVTKRVEVPDGVNAAQFAAKIPPAAWDAAETVPVTWPHDAPADVAAPPTDITAAVAATPDEE